MHCLWNHLVETGGRETGSLLIWDTGEYEVPPPRGRRRLLPPDTDPDSDLGEDEQDENNEGGGEGHRRGDASPWEVMTQQQRLAASFASRKIRLRLRGARLPRQYAVNLRLTRAEDAAGRARAARAAGIPPWDRRRRSRGAAHQQQQPPPKRTSTHNRGPETSSSSEEEGPERGEGASMDSRSKTAAENDLSEMDRDLRELEDEEVRRTNAYAGATNSIGSVHQRRWFLSLDAEACGFARMRREGGRAWWERRGQDEAGENDDDKNRLGWPFYVRGPDHERSVVTGRLGADVLRDEGEVGYVGRRGWRPILH